MKRNVWSTLTALLLVSLASSTPAAAPTAPEEGSQVEKDKTRNWSFTADPALPNVLILGDSISIGYTLQVRKLLEGKANVYRAMTANGRRFMNCQGTTAGLEHIDQWLADRPWAVIHFNWGLHDLKHVKEGGGSEKSNDPKDPLQATVEQYGRNMEKLVGKLKATGARLVFATTTPVVPGTLNPLREPELPPRYNAAAAKIMQANGIRVNDLYAFCLPHLDQWQLPQNVHFRPQGYDALAQRIAAVIQEELAAAKQGRRARADSGSASQTARDGDDHAGKEDSFDPDAGPKDVEPGKNYVYKTSDGQPQDLEVYFPKEWDPAKNCVPGVMMFHGGAWGHGDLTAFRYACKYLASRGLVAATANYKMIKADKRDTMPEGQSRKRVCIIDAKSAIRWMKQHAAELGVDPKRIVVGGGSAGGHLAVLSTINSDLNDRNDPPGVDTKVVGYLLFNPAFTPVGREVDSQVDIFPLLKPGLAPSIMFFGTEDKHWKPGADELTKRIRANGDETTMWTADGQGHGFFNHQPWCDLTLIEADRFLVAHRLLSGPSALPPPANGEKLTRTAR